MTAERMTTRFRQLVARPGLVIAPACFDPLTARIAAATGFECIALGGYALGSASAISEPLMTMTEVVDAARRITACVDVPLIVDAATGFGDPLHVMRAVREFERAGVAAIHIEDQVFPKRAHYHRDYREHTVSAEEMVDKVRFACQARRDPDFAIIARTDTMRTDGYDEGVRRARLYAEAGADLVMLFPNSADEAARAPGDCPVPLVYVNSSGNRVGRPVYPTQELERLGYKICYDAISVTIASFQATSRLLRTLKETGLTGLDPAEAIAGRKAIEDTIGLEEHYAVEEQTVERPS
ncbi:MAG: isocitrate lyase/PEP mutase family protein [Chloroflexota bacterium]